MATTKPNVLRVWASGAAAPDVVDPDTVDPGKVALGWEELDIPPHSFFNWTLNNLNQFVTHVNEFGVAQYDVETDYPVNARVLGSDGKIYKSIQTPNINQEPTTKPLFWKVSNDGGIADNTVDWKTGANIASAATINLDTATGNRVHVTGTTSITAVTLTRGPRTIIFDGILTLVHHITDNNLPSGISITTAVGDRAVYESDGSTVYCIAYTKADGTPLVNVPTVTHEFNAFIGVT